MRSVLQPLAEHVGIVERHRFALVDRVCLAELALRAPGNRRRAPPGNKRRAPIVATGRVSLVLPTLHTIRFVSKQLLKTNHHRCCVNVTAQRNKPQSETSSHNCVPRVAGCVLATHEACRLLRYDDTCSFSRGPAPRGLPPTRLFVTASNMGQTPPSGPQRNESHQELHASRCVSCADPCTNDTGTLGDVLLGLVWLPVWNHAEWKAAYSAI